MDIEAVLPVVTGRDIEDVADPSPEFRGWAWDLYFRGELDLIVAAIRKEGGSLTVVEALDYLNQVSREPQQGLNVTVGDMNNRRSRHWRLADLRQLITGQQPRPAEQRLLHGLIGHQAVVDLLTGQPQPIPTKTAPVKNRSQLSWLFPEGEADAQADFVSLTDNSPSYLIAAYRQLSRSTIVLSQLSREKNTQNWPRNIRPRLKRFHTALGTLYGRHFERLQRDAQMLDQQTMLLTCLSWAQLALRQHSQRAPRILFREIPVAPSHQRFSGGRIDAMEVRTISGRPPNTSERQTLQYLSRQSWPSIRHLIMELRRVFGERSLQLVIIDFKFLVGDVIQSERESVPTVWDKPLTEHQDQMLRYLTLIPLIYNHGKKGRHRDGGLWKTNHFNLKGELWYLLADRAPVIFKLKLNGTERERQFAERVIDNWQTVRRRAVVRRTSNQLLTHVMNLVTGTTTAKTKGVADLDHWSQMSLFGPTELNLTILQFIDDRHQQKNWLDQRQILEVVGRNRRGLLLELHLDHLVSAMEAGQHPASNLATDRNCFIHCPLPDHREQTPSCMLYLTDSPPRFKCFGCGGNGRITLASIPTGSVQILAESWKGQPKERHERSFVVSQEQQQIMQAAQEILRRRFYQVEEVYSYLHDQRGLDPDFVGECQGGYADQYLISNLLDQGYSLDQLAHYGFVAFSEKIREGDWLLGYLKHRGLSVDQQRRKIRSTAEGELILGLPYSVLHRRLTFPLTLAGCANNFYGRATWQANSTSKHRKLTIKHTHVPQGGYNLAVLMDLSVEEVIVTEGTFDAVSLKAMGHRPTLAMIGVDNQHIIREIATANKPVAIALDNDVTGRKQTVKLVERLREFQQTAPIRDLTAEISVNFPETCKDPNEWWQWSQSQSKK